MKNNQTLDPFAQGLLDEKEIPDHVLCERVSQTALRFPGVVRLLEDSAERTLDIINKDVTSSSGVRISRKEKDTTVDIYVVVEYGTQIPKLAWGLQKRIQSYIKSITREVVEDINIHIEGVEIDE